MRVQVLLHLKLAILLGGVIGALVKSLKLVVASCRDAERAVGGALDGDKSSW